MIATWCQWSEYTATWARDPAGRLYSDMSSVTRISTGTLTKLGLVVLAFGDVIRSRFRKEADGPARTGLYTRPTG